MTRHTARRRTVVAAAVAVVGAALLVVGTVLLHDRPARHLPRAFSSPPAVGSAAAPSVSPAVPPRPGAASATSPVAGTGVPLRVRIARLHVDAPVVPVRSAGGAIEVPARPATLGWWVGGAVPGSLVGTTVIVGHVDSAATGPGALFHLDEVRAGDVVTVTVTGGLRERYAVTGLKVVPKATGLTDADLSSSGPGRLTLITCGGPFDRTTLSYRDNIVAVATPTS